MGDKNGRTDAAEFIRWRWRNGLSLTAAAEALGVSRRQIENHPAGLQGFGGGTSRSGPNSSA
jgi:hypothetical protein